MLARRETRPLRTFSDPMLGMLDSMRDLQQSFSGLFSDLWQGAPNLGVATTIAPINAYRKGDDFMVECSLPGVKKDDVDIRIENDILTIRGEVREKEEIKEEHYHLREIRQGIIQRSLRLPFEVETEKVQASFRDGMLSVTLHQSEKAKTRGVKVPVQ